MHICPHCQKLGIRSIGNPFSRGLADCRYCHNVSRVKASKYTLLIWPTVFILTIAAAKILLSLNLPHGAAEPWVLFWFLLFASTGMLIGDRLTRYEKYDPPARGPEEASVEAKAGSAPKILMAIALVSPYIVWPTDSFAEGPTLHEMLNAHNDAAHPSFVPRFLHTKCGAFVLSNISDAGLTMTGTFHGHDVTINFDKQAGTVDVGLDEEHQATGFTDANGELTETVDLHGNITRRTHHTLEEIAAAYKRDQASIQRVIDECAPINIMATTKCGLLDNGFDSPAPKVCDDLGIYGDPGYWSGVLGGEFDWDAVAATRRNIDPMALLACAAQYDFCNTTCDGIGMLGGIACGAFGTAAGMAATPAIGGAVIVACGLGDFALWGDCRGRCWEEFVAICTDP